MGKHFGTFLPFDERSVILTQATIESEAKERLPVIVARKENG